MSEDKPFTIGVLCYGDHPELARRCLGSILTKLPRQLFSLRVGLNAVGPATMDYVKGLVSDELLRETDVLYNSPENIKKYPMLRRMVHDPVEPASSKYFMWFDDDSFVRPETDGHLWLADVMSKMRQADMLGAVYFQGVVGNQWAWVQDQPWYRGLPRPPKFKFCTGGWWTIKTDILHRFNWPVPELLHRGGDVMLGELFRQQGLTLTQYNTGVAINADDAGRQCGAKKRGFDSPPVGHDYDPGVTARIHETTRGPIEGQPT